MPGVEAMCERGDCNLSKAICTVTIDVVQALALERDSLKEQIRQRDRDIAMLRGQHDSASGRESRTHRSDSVLSERSEATYLHIIGGLLMLLLGRSPSGKPYSSFTTQESVINALVEQHGTLAGISERTLLAKFAAAKRTLIRD